MSDYYYLPQELVVQIFTNLPVKSLLRFRTLSKSWRSLISSPDFIRKHALANTTRKKVLIMNDICIGGKQTHTDYTLYDEDQLPLSSSGACLGVPVQAPHAGYAIAGSCNGILCLFHHDIHLWNYSVRRKLTILKQDLDSYTIVGFGFDPITNDYKILTLHFGATLRVFLYTLNTASWSAIAPPATWIHVETGSCFVNGTLNWGVKRYQHEPQRCIMTFDLSTHDFGTISFPEPSVRTDRLTVINDSLAVVCSKGKEDTWIWVRTESNNVLSWSVFLKLQIPGFEVQRVLQPNSNGDLIITLLCVDMEVGDKFYNPRTGVLSTPLDYGNYGGMQMEAYVESLELLDRGTPCGIAFRGAKKSTSSEDVFEHC